MDFNEYNNLPSKDQKDYLEFSNASKNLSEQRKNDAEAMELNSPFYRRSRFWIVLISTLTPTLLAVVAFFGTNAREFFDNKVKEVRLEKWELQLQIDSLNRIRDKFEKDSLFLNEYYKDQYSNEIKDIMERKRLDSLEKIRALKENNQLEKQLFSIRTNSENDLNKYKKEIEDLIIRLKDKNDDIMVLKRYRFDPYYHRGSYDLGRTLLIKNILIYMMNEKKLKVSYEELIKNVHSSINHYDLTEIIWEYDNNSKLIWSNKDSNGNYFLNMSEKITTDYLVNFEYQN